MKTLTLLIAFTISLAGCSPADQSAAESSKAAASEAADTAYTNGKIYTVNDAQAWVEAVAIKDGKFIVVGSASDVEAVTGDGTEVIDLGGKFAMPGLVEAHTHGLIAIHPKVFQADLDTTDQESLLRSVQKYAEKNPDREWISGEHWPIGMFPNDNPNRELLDDVVPDRPVYLQDQSGHSAWLNSKAIELTGLDNPDLELDARAVVERDASGKATGTVREFAMGYVKRFLPPTPVSEWEETARQAQPIYHAFGFTATRLAGGDLDRIRALRNLEDRDELKMHVSMAMDYDRYDSVLTKEQQLDAIRQTDQYISELLDPTGIKIFLDGTQLARAAWNFEPYPGQPDNFGTNYFTPEELAEFVTLATGMNRSVMAHACGSRSVHEFLNAIEAAQQKYPDSTVRHHPTHNIQIDSRDFGRFKQLGVAAELSPQMIMTPALVEQLTGLVGRDVLENEMWRGRDFINAGDTLAFASDWTVSALDPWIAMEYQVTRENDQFPDMGKVAPTSAVTVAEAIRAYTYGGAFALGKEDQYGTIEPGKSADLVILDRNLLELEEAGQSHRISETQVLYTVFRGEIVYENIQLTTPPINNDWGQ